MNTRKQVLLMSGLLAMMLIVVGIYGAWYPSREKDAEAHFEEATAKRGAITFARNCRLCHGDIGEGGAAGARLTAAPALDRPDLQGFDDSTAVVTANINARDTTLKVDKGSLFEAGDIIYVDDEQMEITGVSNNDLTVIRGVDHTSAAAHTASTPINLFDEAFLDEKLILMRDTIACGRVGTAMPAWSTLHGGPLSDEQIRQLLVVISENYWEEVKHEVDHEDIRTELTEDIDGEELIIPVKDVTVLNVAEAYRIGEERIRVSLKIDYDGPEGDGKAGEIVVERGILQSSPIEHSAGEIVYLFPEVSEPATNQQSCGQTARPAVEAAPPGLIEPFTGPTLEITAAGVVFNTNALSAPANTSIRVRLVNNDTGIDHNIAFYQSRSSTTAPLVAGSIGTVFKGVNTDDTVFTTPAAGSYFFRCDVHPTTMTGTFTVQ